MAAFQVIAVQMAVFLAVADHRFDRRAAPEFLFDLTVDPALLSGAEDPHGFWRIVADIALVHVDPLDLPAGQGLGFFQHLRQGVAIIWVSRQGLGVQDELAALAAFIGRGQRDLDAELIGLVRLALGDAFGLRGMPGIQLPAALALFPGL